MTNILRSIDGYKRAVGAGREVRTAPEGAFHGWRDALTSVGRTTRGRCRSPYPFSSRRGRVDRRCGTRRRKPHAGAGARPMKAPRRGSTRTAARMAPAATAITTKSRSKPQLPWIQAMRGRVDALTENVTM